MTVEDVIREGRIAGIDFFDIYNWTWGEIAEYVEIVSERERRRNKALSLISFYGNNVLCKLFGSKDTISVMEEYPFWTDEEQTEAKLEYYRSILTGGNHGRN